MKPPALIDTHVSLGHWPWMDFNGLTAEALESHLESQGIVQSWVAATESILFPDPDVPDARLFAALERTTRLVPVKTINPLLGNWRESLTRAIGTLGMRLVKILPSYHRYSVCDAAALELADVLARAGIPLLIAMRLEDERNQYPLMKVPAVAVDGITRLAASQPGLRVVALGATAGEIASLTSGTPNVYCDLSFAETGNVMEDLLASTPASQLVFGSHTPFFYTRAAVRKLVGAPIKDAAKRSIAHDNAIALLVPRS